MAKTNKHPGGSKSEKIIRELTKAYWSELETVQNYIAASTNLIGIRAEEVKKSLAADITAELGHAQLLAKRIHVLGGTVPGSYGFKPAQKSLQPPRNAADLVAVIKGVIDAEQGAIDQYSKIVGITDGVDYVTQDMVIGILGDEEAHRREFQNFLAEYKQKG